MKVLLTIILILPLTLPLTVTAQSRVIVPPTSTSTPASTTTPTSTTTSQVGAPTPKQSGIAPRSTAPRPIITPASPVTAPIPTTTSNQILNGTSNQAGAEQGTKTNFLLWVGLAFFALFPFGYLVKQSLKKTEKDEDNNKCFNIKKMMEDKLNELTDLRAQVEGKVTDELKEKIKEGVEGTSIGSTLVLLEIAEKKYEKLKKLYEECMIEFDTVNKLIILGPQYSGKTTLTRFLREQHPDLPILEEDELFTELNGGEYPEDIEYKEKILRSKLEEKIRKSDNLVFVSSYCNPILLKELKSKGFKVVQLVLSQEEFQKRNEKRMRENGYADANVWSKEISGFHDEVKKEGWADKEVNASQSVEVIAKEVLHLIS